VFERWLTRIVRTSTQHATSGELWPWGAIGIVAFLMRRSLRQTEQVHRVKVKRGHPVSIAVRDSDD
jgi:hypothetical protein